MTAYEMMLSESQERMLMVLHPEKADVAATIFRKWGLDFAAIGKTTDDLRFVVKRHGKTMADLPIKQLGDQAPTYDRPWIATPKQPILSAAEITPPVSNRDALLKLISSPDLGSKRWVYEQYDTLILGNTVEGPGGDAAVIRLDDGPKGLALTTDATPRYCEADPVEGGRQAVAEAWRNLIAVGARPLALTDNLNFGNPEKPQAMGQFVGCLTGVGEAARALDFPIVSRAMCRSTTKRWAPASCRRRRLAASGWSMMWRRRRRSASRRPAMSSCLSVVGGELARPVRLSREQICGREEGAPPPVDLAAERRNGEFIFALIRAGRLTAVHDISDGGLRRDACRDGGRGRPWRGGRGQKGRRRFPPRLPCSARTKAAMSSRRARVRRTRFWRRPAALKGSGPASWRDQAAMR